MLLESIATAVPPNRYTQRECYLALAGSPVLAMLKPRSQALLKQILCTGQSGIETRHLAAPSIEQVIGRSAQQMNRDFEREAPRLAAVALRVALERAEMKASQLDGLIVSTCTGYLCPGISSHLAEIMQLREDVALFDNVGLGCGAAIPMLRSAAGFLALHPGARVATVAVEICSAAFYADDDPGVLVSLCLFGDGAAAAIWVADPGSGNGSGSGSGKWRAGHFSSLHVPEHREKIRFVNADGKLRNQLDKAVPALAADAVRALFQRRAGEPDAILAHSGGRDVIDGLEVALKRSMPETREVLAQFGNMSSPSVLFALERALGKDGCGGLERLWLAAFGAGFAAHACEMWRAP